jgi:predicted RNA-binding protein with PIN domain
MPRLKLILLDGYNVVHAVPSLARLAERGLDLAREGLVRRCAERAAARRDGTQFCVVFDGDSEVQGVRRGAAPAVDVVFSRTGETADERILALVDAQAAGTDCTVVSNDAYVTGQARLRRAAVLSVEAWGGEGARRRVPTAPDRGDAKNGISPGVERAITDELRDLWGAR